MVSFLVQKNIFDLINSKETLFARDLLVRKDESGQNYMDIIVNDLHQQLEIKSTSPLMINMRQMDNSKVSMVTNFKIFGLKQKKKGGGRALLGLISNSPLALFVCCYIPFSLTAPSFLC